MEKHDKFARNWGRLLKYSINNGIDYLAYSLFRTTAQQQELFKQGKSHCDGVKARSRHQDGCAGDLVILVDGAPCWDEIPEYAKLGAFWENVLGGRWGGHFNEFKDIYHFEV